MILGSLKERRQKQVEEAALRKYIAGELQLWKQSYMYYFSCQRVHPGPTRTSLDLGTWMPVLLARMKTRKRCQGQRSCTSASANEASGTLIPLNAPVSSQGGHYHDWIALKDSGRGPVRSKFGWWGGWWGGWLLLV